VREPTALNMIAFVIAFALIAVVPTVIEFETDDE